MRKIFEFLSGRSSVGKVEKVETAPDVVSNLKTWKISQEYEIEHAILFTETEWFKEYSDSIDGDMKLIKDTLRRYFFRDDNGEFEAICGFAEKRRCLEIGSSSGPLIQGFGSAQRPAIIEPLASRITAHLLSKGKRDIFSGFDVYPIDASIIVDALVGQIDGVIYVRNCIDHSPKWPFILSSIASYASTGCKLVFWSELYHGEQPDDGHYNITNNSKDILCLLENLGFKIERTFSDCPDLPDLGLIATKR